MELETAVARTLDRRVRKHTGVAVGVRTADGVATFGRGGVDDGTIFEIGSITKLFTALLLADAAQRGLVALDDPVQRYLPEDARIPVRGRPITLADVATHSAGLPGIPKGMLKRALTERSNPWGSYATDDLLEAIPRTRLRRAPGRKSRYSNYGFGLLGHVLAERAGTTYEELVQERICRPLGLVDTSTIVPPEKLDRFAQGYNRRGRPVPHWEIPGLPGAGALRSTVRDLLAFVELNRAGGDTPLAEAARTTHTPRRKLGRTQIGLAWLRQDVDGRTAVWHNGGTGGFRSVCGFVEGGDVSVVVLTNCSRWVDRVGLDLVKAL